MKVLVCGDIHGRHKAVTNAFDKFLSEDYDKIIFTGDICDSHDANDNDIIRCWNIINTMIKAYPDKVIVLLGNHDIPYLHFDPEKFRCSGFRSDLHKQLYFLLHPMRNKYKVAYGISNFLFTHAGVQYNWFAKHFDIIDKWAESTSLDVTDPGNLWLILNMIYQTRDADILFEAGPKRGGMDSDFGGPFWCDLNEIIMKAPYPGLNQIIGHTPTEEIYRFHRFQNGKYYKDTSVCCIDVLSSKVQFLTLQIKE